MSHNNGIVFAAVARERVIVASCDQSGSDIESLCATVLPQVPQFNTKAAYHIDHYDFNVLVEDGLIYLCACSPEFARRLAYSFLVEVKNKFSCGSLAYRAQQAGKHELDRDFSHVLSGYIDRWNRGEGDSLAKLNSQVEEVKVVMLNNIEKVMERGDKIDHLLDKTSDLEYSANQFRTSSKRVRRHMMCKNVKMWIILILVVVIVITIIILFSTNIIPVRSSPAPAPTVTSVPPPTP